MKNESLQMAESNIFYVKSDDWGNGKVAVTIIC